MFKQKRKAKLTIPVDEPVQAPPTPPAPAPLPGIQANRYEMVFTVIVGDVPALIVGSPIVRDVAPIYTRFE
jgi:hypothetical protein